MDKWLNHRWNLKRFKQANISPCNLSVSQRSCRGSTAGRVAVGSRHQLQTLVQKEPPGVGDFTLLPSSTASHCGLLNRYWVGSTPAVPPPCRRGSTAQHSLLLVDWCPDSVEQDRTKHVWIHFQVYSESLFCNLSISIFSSNARQEKMSNYSFRCSCPSIHPLSIPLILNRVAGVLEPIPAGVGQAAG